MAKDNIALLNEIAGQLRKLNQSNLRDTLKTKEFQDRQEAIMAGQPQAADQGPLFVDAAEDFRRRVKGSVTGARLAEEITDSGKRAKGWVEDDKKKETNEGLANAAEQDATDHLSNIHQLLVAWRNDFTVGVRNAARDAAENTLEKNKHGDSRGMHPNSIATRIKPGFGLEKEMPIPEVDKGNFITRNIKKVVAAVTIGSSMAISDIVRGYKKDGLDGAISSFLGGNGEGSMGNAIRQAFVLGTTGIATGAAIGAMGGPVGALAGGIAGLALGAITGFLGADRINAWMDEAGMFISNAWFGMTDAFKNLGKMIGGWIYTRGTGARSGNHPAINATMFGGHVSWDIDDYGSTFTSAFIKVMDDILSLPGKIASWIKRTINEKSPALGQFLFGDGLTTEERETKRAMEVLTAAKTTSGSFKSGFDKAEVAFAGAMGQAEAEKLFFGDTREDFIMAVRNGDYGLTGAADPGSALKFTHSNLQFDGDEKFANAAAEFQAEEIKRKELEIAAEQRAKELRTMTQQTADRNLMRQNGYGAPVIVTGQNDQSSTTISTTINTERKPGARAGFGASTNAVMGEDGFVYSW